MRKLIEYVKSSKSTLHFLFFFLGYTFVAFVTGAGVLFILGVIAVFVFYLTYVAEYEVKK